MSASWTSPWRPDETARVTAAWRESWSPQATARAASLVAQKLSRYPVEIVIETLDEFAISEQRRPTIDRVFEQIRSRVDGPSSNKRQDSSCAGCDGRQTIPAVVYPIDDSVMHQFDAEDLVADPVVQHAYLLRPDVARELEVKGRSIELWCDACQTADREPIKTAVGDRWYRHPKRSICGFAHYVPGFFDVGLNHAGKLFPFALGEPAIDSWMSVISRVQEASA